MLNNPKYSLFSRTKAHWLAVGSVFILLLLWHCLTEYTSLINPLFLPSPRRVLAAFFTLADNQLGWDVLATVLRVLVAFALSVACALPVAVLISESNTARKLLSPYIDFIRYLPVPVLIPLTILFFGIGEEAKIILLFIGTFFQIALLFVNDLDHVPAEYYDLAFTLNFSAVEKIFMKLRTALPSMYDNMRISLGLCWSYVIIVELVASETGLGHMIKEAQRFSHTSEVYVGIIIMGLIGFSSDLIFRKTYKLLFPYLS